MSYRKDSEKSPIMQVGRYNGKPVDTLPHSYLRWMIGQNFPKVIVEAAKKKLESSDYSDLHLNVSRHALDMFSKRFLHLWSASEGHKGEDAVGLATFVATMAQEAFVIGMDVSKHRHQDDGVVKLLNGLRWVFNVNPSYPDYKDVITVMGDT